MLACRCVKPSLLPFLATLLVPAPAVAQLEPSPLPPLDPAEVAHVIRVDEGATPRLYAMDGRFAGDLNGDGLADWVLPGATAPELHVFFGSADLDPTEQDLDDGDGDSVITLPADCRDGDHRVQWAALGDIDGDGRDDLGAACGQWGGTIGPDTYLGQVPLYLGRASWPSSVDTPDASLLGTPLTFDGSGFPNGGFQPGSSIVGLGDLTGDGRDEFAVSGFDMSAIGRPTAWVFEGRADVSTFASVSDANWLLSGPASSSCISPVLLAAPGDIDGDDIPELAGGCVAWQSAADPVPRYSVWLGSELAGLGSGTLDFSTRSFWLEPTVGLQTYPGPLTALGDLDGDGYDEFGVVSWNDGLGTVSGRVVAGHPEPWTDISGFDQYWLTAGELDPYTSFQPAGLYGAVDGMAMAPAGDLDGDGSGDLWVRIGTREDVRVGLLTQPRTANWAEISEPPFVVTFGSPGGIEIVDEERFGLGGAADANGDGVPDLLITSGTAAGGCTADTCGGAWLILCVDADEDGVGVCGGDCDDGDPTAFPGALEVCDAVDHDCDGNDGSVDGDGDGLLVCDGDCDDADPTRYPGAEETCDDTEDLDCDGLLPGGDLDGDGAANCEDCQPFLAAMTPGAEEVCDGLDNDCDGSLPKDEQDVDADGLPACAGGAPADCDDLDPLVGPRRFEDCFNGRDDNCDGVIDTNSDVDGDGVSSCDGDCDDADADVFPGHEELCDGLDNNCNGVVDDARDDDGDGASVCDGDCDDRDPTRFPGRVEVCDGGDLDCIPGADLLDLDGDGWSPCAGDCDDGEPGISPVLVEYCDGLDNDCDGIVDNPFDVDGDGWATCLGDCDDDSAVRFPQPVEPLCTDSFDGDCDGLVDANDPDCFVEEEPPPPEPRPYGLSCASSVAGAGASSGLLLLPLLLLGRRRRRARGVLMGLAALVLVPSVALAAKKEPALLVYLSAQPDVAAMQEARSQTPKLDAAEILHHTELLAPARGLVAAGAKSTKSCKGKAPALGSATTATLDALIELDFGKAVITSTKAIDGLACADQAIPARLLPDLFYYRGIARYAQHDAAGADADFAQVVALSSDYQTDPNFDPAANARLRAAQQRAGEGVDVFTYAPPGLRMRIDGKDREASDGAVVLQPGLHVAQVEVARATETLVFEVGDQPVTVLRADDRMRALRDAPVLPGARAFAARTLREAALTADVDLVALVDLEVVDEPLRYLYRAGSDAFSFEDAELAGSTGRSSGKGGNKGGGSSGGGSNSASSGSSSGQAGMTVVSSGGGKKKPSGGGATVARVDGPVLRLRVSGGFAFTNPFPYVQIPIDVGIRLVQGLHLDLQFAAANPGPTEVGPVWLPTGALGLSYRIPLGAVEPRLGGAFQIGVDDSKGSVGPLPGGYGLVGVDVLVPGTPLLIGADLRAGVLGKPFFLGVSGGVGVAF